MVTVNGKQSFRKRVDNQLLHIAEDDQVSQEGPDVQMQEFASNSKADKIAYRNIQLKASKTVTIGVEDSGQTNEADFFTMPQKENNWVDQRPNQAEHQNTIKLEDRKPFTKKGRHSLPETQHKIKVIDSNFVPVTETGPMQDLDVTKDSIFGLKKPLG